MNWITAGLKRGPYMLRIALPFPGHVPSGYGVPACCSSALPFDATSRPQSACWRVHCYALVQRTPGPPGRPRSLRLHAAPKKSGPQLTAVLLLAGSLPKCQSAPAAFSRSQLHGEDAAAAVQRP